MALIELDSITRSYTVGGSELKVLKGITLCIEEGEFVAIMGPSGSGKSTLMQILGLLDRPTSGRYRLLGHDVSRLSDDEGAILRSRTIGFIFQMFNLLSRTSALDNVILPMLYSGAKDRQERALDVLEQVGLSDRVHHRPNELSGGQQQRVAIARSLVNHPRIIFADEPTGNLASDQAEDILRQLQLLNRGGITVIMVTHEPDIAAHARRIIRIKDGSVVADERTGEGEEGLLRGGAAVKTAATRSEMKVDLSHPPLGLAECGEYAASALRAITANKVRSALSMLGILIGVAAVIAMLAIGRGAQKSIEARLSSLGSNLLMLQPGGHSAGGVHMAEGSVSRLTLDDVAALRKADPGILRVEGNVSGSAQIVYRDKNTNTQVTGATPFYAPMRNAQPYYGRFFTDAEDAALARVALLGQSTVNNLFGSENPVGKMVKINRVSFKVIGILPLKGAGGFRDQDDMAIIPLNTAMKRVLGKKYLNMIAIECSSADVMPASMEAVTALMRRRHHLPAYKDDDFSLRNMADIQAALSGTSKTFSMLLGIVAAISLLVGGIGIMNIMLVSVSERTREIGLRKAVGAARRAILVQFLIEAAIMSSCGGILGILLGAAVSLAVSLLAGWAAIVAPQAVILSFVFSAGVGVVFGLWPARKASLLSPIEALRYE
ncbi:MAG: ABC transporter permease [Elusimicrobiota bacterium]|jgi:macrolide transport system ATP-binding/permease protein